MTQQYNTETISILLDWINALKQKENLDPEFVADLEALVDSGEIGDTEDINKVIAALEERQ